MMLPPANSPASTDQAPPHRLAGKLHPVFTFHLSLLSRTTNGINYFVQIIRKYSLAMGEIIAHSSGEQSKIFFIAS
jgi:hypothetical protein